MKEITNELEAIIAQLHAEGKEPTTALVKNRLISPVPLPAIITALKSWKSGKHIPKIKVESSNADLETKVADLEARVATLEIKLSQLQTILESQS